MQGDTLVMQHKVHPTSPDWRPKEGGIFMWKKDHEGKSMLPPGCPHLLPMAKFVKDHEHVI